MQSVNQPHGIFQVSAAGAAVERRTVALLRVHNCLIFARNLVASGLFGGGSAA